MAKKLLNERTVRRFQKLAMVSPINEMYHKRDEEMEEAMHGKYAKRDDEVEEGMYGKRDEDEMEEGMYAKRDEDEMEEGMYKRDDEKLMEKEEEPMDMGDEEGGMDGDLELTDEEAQAIIDLGMKLKGAMGDEEPAMDMAGDDLGDEKEMMEAEDEMEEDLMEALSGINYIPSKTEVVNEVAKGVASRLKEEKLYEAKYRRALGRK